MKGRLGTWADKFAGVVPGCRRMTPRVYRKPGCYGVWIVDFSEVPRD